MQNTGPRQQSMQNTYAGPRDQPMQNTYAGPRDQSMQNTYAGPMYQSIPTAAPRSHTALILFVIVILLATIGVLLYLVLKPKAASTPYDTHSDITDQFNPATMAFSIPAIRLQAIDAVQSLLRILQIPIDAGKIGTMKDITLYAILKGDGQEAILDTINFKMPYLHNDGNYINVMKLYNPTTGLFRSTDRNTAIVISNKYIKATGGTTNSQSLSDASIYAIMISVN